MILQIRLFAQLRERAGSDSIEAELDEGATVADALRSLAEGPPLGELLARLPVRMAVNRELVSVDTTLHAGDELALLPPVSGGAGPHVRVQRRAAGRRRASPTSSGGLGRARSSPSRAPFVTSTSSTTRPTARWPLERMAAIVADAIERHGLQAAAAEHRVGRVALGEPGVVVAAAAAHREEAFAGAREIIDTIKAQAPIWKRELEGDQARWVPGDAVA